MQWLTLTTISYSLVVIPNIALVSSGRLNCLLLIMQYAHQQKQSCNTIGLYDIGVDDILRSQNAFSPYNTMTNKHSVLHLAGFCLGAIFMLALSCFLSPNFVCIMNQSMFEGHEIEQIIYVAQICFLHINTAKCKLTFKL